LEKKGEGITMTNTRTRQIMGITLLAAGWGWAGVNFTPPDSLWWNYLLHAIPILLLLVFSLGFFSVADGHERAGSNAGWASIGLNIFAGISFFGFIAGIILGISNPHSAYGISTIGDWVAAVILILGGLLWLTTLIPVRRDNAEIRTANR
jgi:predicted acyltransferase